MKINYNLFINKNKILLFLLLFTSLSFSQTRLPGSTLNSNISKGNSIDFNKEKQLKKDIDIAGLSVAKKLMICCSSYGGKDVYSIIDYNKVRVDPQSGKYTIPMTVGWYGSISRGHFFIKGKLIIYSNGSKDWIKIRDSGGFKTGCSNGCIK